MEICCGGNGGSGIAVLVWCFLVSAGVCSLDKQINSYCRGRARRNPPQVYCIFLTHTRNDLTPPPPTKNNYPLLRPHNTLSIFRLPTKSKSIDSRSFVCSISNMHSSLSAQIPPLAKSKRHANHTANLTHIICTTGTNQQQHTDLFVSLSLLILRARVYCIPTQKLDHLCGFFLCKEKRVRLVYYRAEDILYLLSTTE